MDTPDAVGLISANALLLLSLLFLRYRHLASVRRAEADAAEEARLTGWVTELHAAGVDQATDPNLGAVIRRYAEVHGTGRHRAVGNSAVRA